MNTIDKCVLRTSIGPAELDVARAYVHDAELEGDEELTIGMRVEVLDDAGRHFAATVTHRVDHRWQLTLRA